MHAPSTSTMHIPMAMSGPATAANGTSGITSYGAHTNAPNAWNANGYQMPDANAYVTRAELMLWESQIKAWVESRLTALTSQSPTTPIRGLSVGMSPGMASAPAPGMPMGPPTSGG